MMHLTNTAVDARRILIVDSYHDSADSLHLLLEMKGHDVRVAYSADDIRDIFDFQPEVVLLDIVLPGDGYALGRELEAKYGCTVLILTGYYTPAVAAKSRSHGWKHLLKPVSADVLDRLIQSVPVREYAEVA